jgi:hypothetical protein
MEVLNVQEDLGLINSVKNFVEGVATAVLGKIRIQTKKRVCATEEKTSMTLVILYYISPLKI